MVEQFTYFNSVKQSTISISFEKVDYFTFWLGRLFYKVDQNVVPQEKVGERFTMYHDASSSKMNDKQCGTCSALFSKDFFQIMAPFVLYSR